MLSQEETDFIKKNKKALNEIIEFCEEIIGNYNNLKDGKKGVMYFVANGLHDAQVIKEKLESLLARAVSAGLNKK